MPYIDGKRVSNAEWVERFGSLKLLHTGPNGENPAPAGEEVVDEAPKAAKAPRARSARAQKAAKAAIADALGESTDSEALAAIDVSGLDAESEENS